MSLSPFVSFQSLFVTYLLTFPRINNLFSLKTKKRVEDFEQAEETSFRTSLNCSLPTS